MKKSLPFKGVFFGLFSLFYWCSAWSYAGLPASTVNASEASAISTSLACSTPTWPTTSNITNTTATFNWDDVSGALSYSVETRLPNGTWYSIPGNPVYNPYVTVGGFNPNTTYEWRVRANCTYGQYSSWTYPVSFTTTGSGGYCNAPAWLYTTNITQTSATWDWAPVNGCASYSIQWRYPGGAWYNLPNGPYYNTWVNVSGLQPCTTYEWRVRANCSGGGYSEWSYSDTFTTACYTCNAPSWTSTTNITENCATLNWSGVSGAQSYTVQIRLLNGSWYNITGCPFYGTWTNACGLVPNTTYQWHVRANCGGGQYSPWSSTNTFTTLGSYQTCDAPNWLYTTGITQTAATFDWEPVSSAQSYTVEYRLSGGTWITLYGSPFYNTWASVSGLNPGTAYQWRVRSNCFNGYYSAWSYVVNFTTLGYSCSTPYWTYTTNITQSSANLSWSSVAGAQSYSVQTRLLNGTWYDVPGGNVYNTNVTVYNLNPNTTYQWRVRANCNSWQYSEWTYPVTFTTLGATCETPGWLYASNVTQNSATLTWAAVSGASSYSVEWRLPGGTWYNLSGGPFTETWAPISGLDPGTTYEWRVRTNCYNGQYSPWSYPSTFTTLGYSCGTPYWTSTTNITGTTATFNWSAVSGGVAYVVQYRLPNGTWYDVPGSPTYNTSITVNGLNPNTQYQWRVRADCGNGAWGNWTSPINFTTLYGSSCDAPSWLFTTNITQTSAVLNWDVISGALSYSVQWRELGGSTWYDLQGGPFSNPSAPISGLTPGITYQWRVKSNCANGMMSAWSGSITFTTQGSACNAPYGISTTNVTDSTATLNWSAVPGAVSYTVQIRLINGTYYDIPGNPFTGTSTTVHNLLPGATYQWHVRTNCGGNTYSYWSAYMTFTTTGAGSCSTPVGVTTSNITQTTATWSWSPVSGAVSYSVQWRYPGGAWYALPGGPWSNTSLNIAGLQPNTAYEWRVRANCPNGLYSPWSVISAFTTLGNSCGTPSGTFTNNITETSATFNWNSVSGAVNYTVQTRLLNGTWYDAPGGPVTATSLTLNIFNAYTTYQWRVRANCGNGQTSSWTYPLTFTTLGASAANDHCSDAVVITVNSTCMNTAGSNVGATPSTPAPVGGCPFAGYKDVWFRFAMPNVNNPTVTIRTTAGSLTNAVMEVYVGTDCSNLSYLTCEDDNLNGNGSAMPVINLIGYPNAMIWVRVWGYGGVTGTFSVCVLDYQSSNFTGADENIESSFGEELGDLQPEAVHFTTDYAVVPTAHVSPNPTSDILNVTLGQTEKCVVSGLVMTDLSGKVVLRKEYKASGTTEFRDELDVSAFTPGIYILQLVTTSGIITEKVSVITN